MIGVAMGAMATTGHPLAPPQTAPSSPGSVTLLLGHENKYLPLFSSTGTSCTKTLPSKPDVHCSAPSAGGGGASGHRWFIQVKFDVLLISILTRVFLSDPEFTPSMTFDLL